jgi:hypothetical protein
MIEQEATLYHSLAESGRIQKGGMEITIPVTYWQRRPPPVNHSRTDSRMAKEWADSSRNRYSLGRVTVTARSMSLGVLVALITYLSDGHGARMSALEQCGRRIKKRQKTGKVQAVPAIVLAL